MASLYKRLAILIEATRLKKQNCLSNKWSRACIKNILFSAVKAPSIPLTASYFKKVATFIFQADQVKNINHI